jgi:tRNA(Ile)-lysidine synthase
VIGVASGWWIVTNASFGDPPARPKFQSRPARRHKSPPLHYHLSVREKVLRYVLDRKLMRAGDRICVAVSGGADSVALLRVLLELRGELGIVLAVAHFNHQLRGEASEADEAFVADLARRHDLELFLDCGDVRDHSVTSKLSLEAAARHLRYCWLSSLADSHKLSAIATGHTLDDQAETVLLKFLRGAGTRGLAGIYPEIASKREGGARIVRPLLGVSREEVEQYLAAIGQSWREDESNLDHRFARNRVRHELLPLLERAYNPNIRLVLSDAAELARAEEEYWHALVDRELHDRMVPAATQRLSLANFRALPLALQRRLLKRLLESHQIEADFQHVEKLRRCALGEVPKAGLPGGWLAERQGEFFELQAPGAEPPFSDYQYPLPVPGETHIAELGLTVRCIPVPEEFATGEATDTLLSTELGTELTVRNWRPGDCFWPAHSKSEEKLKRLFSDKHIPVAQRQSWPVLVCGSQIVWVRGLPVGRAFAWTGKGDALKIELTKMESSPIRP